MSKYRLAGEFSRMFFLLTKYLSVILCHWIEQYSGQVMVTVHTGKMVLAVAWTLGWRRSVRHLW